MQSLQELRRRDIPIETIIDVGVLTQTPELVSVFPDRKHLLFEAVAEFGDSIRKNYCGIDYTLVTAAVADREGEATLRTRSIIPGMDISHSGIVQDPVGKSDTRSVPMVTLDGYLSRNPQRKPYLLKLDVDGFELQIMQGASQTLKDTSV